MLHHNLIIPTFIYGSATPFLPCNPSKSLHSSKVKLKPKNASNTQAEFVEQETKRIFQINVQSINVQSNQLIIGLEC